MYYSSNIAGLQIVWRIAIMQWEERMMINCLFVGMGGFIGSVCRYLLGLLPIETSQGFPVKTLITNVIGAFVIGIVAAAAAKNTALNPRLVLFLKAGICGGFTTFSTFAYETGAMMEKGQTGLALLYVILSAILGVLAVFCGQLLVR